VLIVVVMGVMSLSNSLIVGTVVNADKTIINRWASEGIELTQKIRDDSILNKSKAPNWFLPAIRDYGDDYGWYKLSTLDNATWNISKVADSTIDPGLFTSLGETLNSDQLVGSRLICVEAIGASALSDNDQSFNCNVRDSSVVKDGSRSVLDACQDTNGQFDQYCQMTKDSINQNQLSSSTPKIIPSGNAVKVRSVVIWQDKSQFRSSSIATIITNWKGYEQ
ncbi:MAG: hypothetical protein Q7K33_00780, partial [Candidatus Berkelbacteria bacterium]|nr:hypothetical protein [Candidatus Berkelbacteria bacterium]